MRQLLLVTSMSYKDLKHDARMSICLILTVASIALPLLLFFGLKNGVVEVMRQRMVNDPAYMEIIPQGTSILDEAWFEEWEKNQHVAFLVPKTRELGVNGNFKNLTVEKAKTVRADMQPTGQGDWLLVRYQIPIPEKDSCVLTTPLAEKLQANVGDELEIGISRQKKGGGLEYGKRTLKVVGVLPLEALGREMAFVPLSLLENMESFRDGFAVEEYGWGGELALAYPVFYEAVLYSEETIDPILNAQIRQRSGFVHMDEIESEVKGWHAYRLKTGSLPINQVKIQALKNLLRGKKTVLVPLAGKDNDFSVNFTEQGLVNAEIKSLPLWTNPNWGGFGIEKLASENKDFLHQELLTQRKIEDLTKIPAFVVLSPQNYQKFTKKLQSIQIENLQGDLLEFSAHLLQSEAVKDDEIYASAAFIGQLNLLVERELVAQKIEDESVQELVFELGRQSFSRFRMYAKSLDDVAPLAKALEESSVVVKTKSAEIERVRKMDHYLNLIIGLIAGASIAGATICLLASLYASVERKRRSLAVLRLLGINGFSLSAFPLTAGFIITSVGFALSIVLYHAVSNYINTTAQDFTLAGEVLCYLSYKHQLYAFALSLVAAFLAGFAASLRLLKIEPSEGLRDE